MNDADVMTNHETFPTVDDATPPAPDLSVIMVADGDGAGLAALVRRFLDVLDARGQSYEFLLIHEARDTGMRAAIAEISSLPGVKTIAPRPWVGLDEAGMDGLRHARGDIVVTLPGWSEIEPAGINTLIDAVGDETGADMASGRRGAPASGVRARLAHGMVRVLFQQQFDDIFCRSRAGRREVFQKVSDLGVRPHFLPLVAVSEGFVVREVDVTPASDAVTPALRRLKPGSHFSALFDLLSLFVALKFLKRPLRFFGAIGMPLVLLGLVITAWLVIARLFFDTPLADRPALVFSVMMLVLGIQIVALGADRRDHDLCLQPAHAQL